MMPASSGTSFASIRVPCVRLDDILGQEVVGILKIDVEGFELEVLKEQKLLIEDSRPLIYVENDRVEKSHPNVSGYGLRTIECGGTLPPLYNANNFFGIAENIYPNVFSINMFAVSNKSSFAVAHKMVEITDSRFHPLNRK